MCLRSINHLSSVISETGEDTSNLLEYVGDFQVLSHVLGSLLFLWEQYEESLEPASYLNYVLSLEHSGRHGRPQFIVSREQLEYLRALSFSWTDIASLLGVSRMTVYRRRAERGLLAEQRDVLSDAKLDAIIRELRRDLPYSGQTVIVLDTLQHVPVLERALEGLIL